jgi:hypothetical protein
MSGATMPAVGAERYCPPQELPDALAALGCPGWEVRACRELVKAMRRDGGRVMRKKWVRPSEAAAWLLANPEWCPFGKNQSAPGLLKT